MQRTTVEPKTVVYEIVCDRCGKEVQREGGDFKLMTSIGFEAGYASIFGDGNRVEIDLCEPCLRDTLGTWLRVRTPEDTRLARMLDKFKPEVHGGEFPTGADATFVRPDDLPVRERMPLDADVPSGGESPWVRDHDLEELADQARAAAGRSSSAIDDALAMVHASDERIAAMESSQSDTAYRKRIVATLSIGSFDRRPIEVCVRWRLQFDGAGGSGDELVGHFLDEQKNESFWLDLDGAAARLLGSDERIDMLPFVVAGFCKAMFGAITPPAPESRDMPWSDTELAIVEFDEPLSSKELIRVALQQQRGEMHVGWRRANGSMRARRRSATEGDHDPVVAVMDECLKLAAEKF